MRWRENFYLLNQRIKYFAYISFNPQHQLVKLATQALFSDKIDNQSIQLKENTQILKALEHLAEVNKAEHDKMFFDIAEINGEIKSMRKDLSNVELITASNWGDLAKFKSVK